MKSFKHKGIIFSQEIASRTLNIIGHYAGKGDTVVIVTERQSVLAVRNLCLAQSDKLVPGNIGTIFERRPR